jgi:hypothetical protein
VQEGATCRVFGGYYNYVVVCNLKVSYTNRLNQMLLTVTIIEYIKRGCSCGKFKKPYLVVQSKSKGL